MIPTTTAHNENPELLTPQLPMSKPKNFVGYNKAIPTPSAEEKIARLAEFMGWEIKGDSMWFNGNPPPWDTGRLYYRFNENKFRPDEDENHFRMVLEKVMEDRNGLLIDYLGKLGCYELHDEITDNLIIPLKATLPTRCRCLVSVLPPPPTNL